MIPFSLRHIVIICCCIAATACKPEFSDRRGADGRGELFGLLTDGTPLICDCALLLPFGDRPGYPRAHATQEGARCTYSPAGVQSGVGSLVATVVKANSRMVFDEVTQSLLSRYPKTEGVKRTRVAAGDVATARGIASSGSDLIATLDVESQSLVLALEEHVDTPAAVSAAEETMLAALNAMAGAASAACR